MRDADVAGAGIAAVGLRRAPDSCRGSRARPPPARASPSTASSPPCAETSSQRQKPPAGPPIAVAVAEDLVGEIEFLRVEPAVFLDMRLVAIGGDRDMLQRHRHLRRGDVAQFEEARRGNLRSPAAKPTRRPGRFERFDSDWNATTLAKSGPGGFQHAGRRLPGVDFRIALVAEDHEAVAVARARSAARDSRAIGDRALRVGGRGEIERDGARQQRRRRARRDRAGSRWRAWSAGRSARNRRRAAPARIGGIERIGHQDRGPARARGRHSGRRRSRPRNSPSRVPFSTRISVSGSIGRGSSKRRAEPVRGGARGTARCPCSIG